MIDFANAKINLGLQVLNKRTDGYHNLETVFYSVPIYDVIEIIPATETKIFFSGFDVPNDGKGNLCISAFEAISKDFEIDPVHIFLHKNIPIGAGLGGGSADAAFTIKMISKFYNLSLSTEQMERYATKLGADCSFFIRNKPVFAEGVGEVLTPINLNLSAYRFVIVKPPIHVATSEAYGSIVPNNEGRNLKNNILLPVVQWKNLIYNDFEYGLFKKYPAIERIKQSLYDSGALYASMSGSGSSVYGIFDKTVDLSALKENNLVYYC